MTREASEGFLGTASRKAWEGEHDAPKESSKSWELPKGLGTWPKGEGVYFVKAMGFIKIGHTADFSSRYITIDRMMPERPEVLAFVLAPRHVETTIHRLLRDHHIKSEWYPDCEAVRGVMNVAIAGQIDATRRNDDGRAHLLDANIAWASASLKQIAAPIERDEPIRIIIERASARAGLSYWRTFDLWYQKARRLEIRERDAIQATLSAADD